MRLDFFLGTSDAQQSSLQDIFDRTRAVFEAQWTSDVCKLVENICLALPDHRFYRRGSRSSPACLSENVIWKALRCCLIDNEYYMNVEEILLIASLRRLNLHVYEYVAAAPMSHQFAQGGVGGCVDTTA